MAHLKNYSMAVVHKIAEDTLSPLNQNNAIEDGQECRHFVLSARTNSRLSDSAVLGINPQIEISSVMSNDTNTLAVLITAQWSPFEIWHVEAFSREIAFSYQADKYPSGKLQLKSISEDKFITMRTQLRRSGGQFCYMVA